MLSEESNAHKPSVLRKSSENQAVSHCFVYKCHNKRQVLSKNFATDRKIAKTSRVHGNLSQQQKNQNVKTEHEPTLEDR